MVRSKGMTETPDRETRPASGPALHPLRWFAFTFLGCVATALFWLIVAARHRTEMVLPAAAMAGLAILLATKSGARVGAFWLGFSMTCAVKAHQFLGVDGMLAQVGTLMLFMMPLGAIAGYAGLFPLSRPWERR